MEIVKKGRNLKQKSFETRCRTLVSTAHLPRHAGPSLEKVIKNMRYNRMSPACLV